MISIHLQPGDLEALRFAYSPLLETVMAYRALTKADYYNPNDRWLQEARRATYGMAFPYMDAMVASQHYIADFITPTPTSTRQTFEETLEFVRATPHDIVRTNVQKVIQHDEDSALRQHFFAYPQESVDCLIEELRFFWYRVLKQHWDSINARLEEDILYRARQMALGGVETMFSDLNPRVQYEKGALRLDKGYSHRDKSYQLTGEGLYLVPILIANQCLSWQIVPEWKPGIFYGARGSGLWYHNEQPDPDEALQITLGAGRAKVLHSLINPSSTGELARQLEITSGAVSQHLTKLTQAGLVESHRSGYRVYYRLSPRGEKLISLFADNVYS